MVGWVLTATSFISTVLLMHEYAGEEPPSKLFEATHVTFSRLIWSLGLSWLVFACVFGYGGKCSFQLEFWCALFLIV